jgi:uncharacterized protein YdeI (YjbR/CyaY-like superfamily)
MKKLSDAAGLAIPDDLAAVLAANRKAQRAFAALPPSHQREYVKWIAEAKKPQTRQRRAIEAARMVLGKDTVK